MDITSIAHSSSEEDSESSECEQPIFSGFQWEAEECNGGTHASAQPEDARTPPSEPLLGAHAAPAATLTSPRPTAATTRTVYAAPAAESTRDSKPDSESDEGSSSPSASASSRLSPGQGLAVDGAEPGAGWFSGAAGRLAGMPSPRSRSAARREHHDAPGHSPHTDPAQDLITSALLAASKRAAPTPRPPPPPPPPQPPTRTQLTPPTQSTAPHTDPLPLTHESSAHSASISENEPTAVHTRAVQRTQQAAAACLIDSGARALGLQPALHQVVDGDSMCGNEQRLAGGHDDHRDDSVYGDEEQQQRQLSARFHAMIDAPCMVAAQTVVQQPLELEEPLAAVKVSDLDALIARLQAGAVMDLAATRPADLPDPSTLFTDSEEEEDASTSTRALPPHAHARSDAHTEVIEPLCPPRQGTAAAAAATPTAVAAAASAAPTPLTLPADPADAPACGDAHTRATAQDALLGAAPMGACSGSAEAVTVPPLSPSSLSASVVHPHSPMGACSGSAEAVTVPPLSPSSLSASMHLRSPTHAPATSAQPRSSVRAPTAAAAAAAAAASLSSTQPAYPRSPVRAPTAAAAAAAAPSSTQPAVSNDDAQRSPSLPPPALPPLPSKFKIFGAQPPVGAPRPPPEAPKRSMVDPAPLPRPTVKVDLRASITESLQQQQQQRQQQQQLLQQQQQQRQQQQQLLQKQQRQRQQQLERQQGSLARAHEAHGSGQHTAEDAKDAAQRASDEKGSSSSSDEDWMAMRRRVKAQGSLVSQKGLHGGCSSQDFSHPPSAPLTTPTPSSTAQQPRLAGATRPSSSSHPVAAGDTAGNATPAAPRSRPDWRTQNSSASVVNSGTSMGVQGSVSSSSSGTTGGVERACRVVASSSGMAGEECVGEAAGTASSGAVPKRATTSASTGDGPSGAESVGQVTGATRSFFCCTDDLPGADSEQTDAANAASCSEHNDGDGIERGSGGGGAEPQLLPSTSGRSVKQQQQQQQEQQLQQLTNRAGRLGGAGGPALSYMQEAVRHGVLIASSSDEGSSSEEEGGEQPVQQPGSGLCGVVSGKARKSAQRGAAVARPGAARALIQQQQLQQQAPVLPHGSTAHTAHTARTAHTASHTAEPLAAPPMLPTQAACETAAHRTQTQPSSPHPPPLFPPSYTTPTKAFPLPGQWVSGLPATPGGTPCSSNMGAADHSTAGTPCLASSSAAESLAGTPCSASMSAAESMAGMPKLHHSTAGVRAQQEAASTVAADARAQQQTHVRRSLAYGQPTLFAPVGNSSSYQEEGVVLVQAGLRIKRPASPEASSKVHPSAMCGQPSQGDAEGEAPVMADAGTGMGGDVAAELRCGA